MADGLSYVTTESFFIKAVTGVCIGYALRVFEHIVWSTKQPREMNPLGNFLWALMILPQVFVLGLAFGYVSLVAMASKINNETVLAASTYLINVLMAYISVDIRELLRRISRL